MTDNNFNDIESSLSAFSFHSLQETFFTINHLIAKGIDINTFLSYMTNKQLKIQNDLKKKNDEFIKFNLNWNEYAKKCSICKIPMDLFRVNTNNTNQVGNNYKSQWFCSKCYNDEYTNEPYELIYQNILNKYKY